MVSTPLEETLCLHSNSRAIFTATPKIHGWWNPISILNSNSPAVKRFICWKLSLFTSMLFFFSQSTFYFYYFLFFFLLFVFLLALFSFSSSLYLSTTLCWTFSFCFTIYILVGEGFITCASQINDFIYKHIHTHSQGN